MSSLRAVRGHHVRHSRAAGGLRAPRTVSAGAGRVWLTRRTNRPEGARVTERDSNRPKAVQDASAEDWLGSNRDPDVLLSVPDLGVDKITLTVDDLHADVDLHARVLDIVELHVGASVNLGKVELDIENVRAQAMLKVKLDKVAQIVERVMATIDNNPELITSLTTRVGRGVEELARNAGEGVREIGAGSGRADATPREIETYHAEEYDDRRPDALAAMPVVETLLVDGEWWNRLEGGDVGPYDTKEAAVKEGHDLAQERRGEHVIRTRTGKIAKRRSYAD